MLAECALRIGVRTADQPLGVGDVSSVTHRDSMSYAGRISQPLGAWDVANVAYMDAIFCAPAVSTGR